jgi:RimJ/RimL family protein N-acetyltransferase
MNVRRQVVRAVQKIGWVHLSEVFFVMPEDSLATVHTAQPCCLTAISPENALMVRDFREESLSEEFCAKLKSGEIGFFAMAGGRAAGNIWATVNESAQPKTARGFMRLMPGEALIHDIVTGASFRGHGIGPYMVTQIIPILFRQHGVCRIIIDVNVNNTPSLRMMNKAGLHAKQKELSVSAFQNLVYHRTLAHYV